MSTARLIYTPNSGAGMLVWELLGRDGVKGGRASGKLQVT